MVDLPVRVRVHDVNCLLCLFEDSGKTIRLSFNFVPRGGLELDNSEVSVVPGCVISTITRHMSVRSRILRSHLKSVQVGDECLSPESCSVICQSVEEDGEVPSVKVLKKMEKFPRSQMVDLIVLGGVLFKIMSTARV